MATFKDIKGRTWPLRVTVATLSRVRTETGHNLLQLAEPGSELLALVAEDPVELFKLVCAVLRPELDKTNLTDETFCDELDQETAEKAVLALMDALFDFFPEKKRALLKGAHGKAVAAHQRLTAKAIEAAESSLASPEIDQQIERALLTELNGKSGNTPGSSPAISDP